MTLHTGRGEPVPVRSTLQDGRGLEVIGTVDQGLIFANNMNLPNELWPGFDTLLRSDVTISEPDPAAAIADSIEAIADFIDEIVAINQKR